MGSLGDTVAALPCFHKLAEAFPNAERHVLTNIPVSAKAAALELILGKSGLIHGVIDYPLKLRSVRQMWSLARRLRALRARTLIYLTPSKGHIALLYRDLLFFRLSGFSRIIGAPVSRDLRSARVDPATGFDEYECSRLARSLAVLGPINLDDPKNWDLRLTEAEQKMGDQALAAFNREPFVAINMGGKVLENHWGRANWRELFRTLSVSHGGYGLLFLGAADEAEAVAGVADAWPGTVVNACGKLLPRESAGALGRASLFIGHDFGPDASRRGRRRNMRRALQRLQSAAEMASLWRKTSDRPTDGRDHERAGRRDRRECQGRPAGPAGRGGFGRRGRHRAFIVKLT